MKTKATVFLLALATVSSYTQAQVRWEQFGDSYPTQPRSHSDIDGFLILEGPGNENPGNFRDYDQTDPRLRMTPERKRFIARQFKYVLMDMESFADRDRNGGPVLSTMGTVYHQECQTLQQVNPNMVVFAYFCFTLIRPTFPWYAAANRHEDWFLREPTNPAQRLKANDKSFFVMDISNPEWRTFFVKFIADTVARYGHRGVFLDNMTRFPFVSNTTGFPDGMFEGWLGHLITFVTQLNAALPPSVMVVCNSLGIDDKPAIPLFGPKHGTDLMSLVSGGASMESFHSTAWRFALDTTLSIMKYFRDNNKAFLAGTHYSANMDRYLTREFGFAPVDTSGWLNGFNGRSTAYPPYATFYRMQMSYLARFLLVTPRTDGQRFGYSFQPGEWLDSYIPYYKPWDESLGAPRGEYFFNTLIGCYQREFTNARVYVNPNEEEQRTVIVPAGWYYYAYQDARTNDIGAARATTNVDYTLNKMEGVVLFKK